MIDSADKTPIDPHSPLSSFDEWEDDLLRRYPKPAGQGAVAEKKPAAFRDHEGSVRPSVREFYRLNHTHQSVDFVRQKMSEYLPCKKRQMSV
jgi:inositol oxygenase